MRVDVVYSDYTDKQYIFIDTENAVSEVAKIEMAGYNELVVEDGDEPVTEDEFISMYLKCESSLAESSGLVYVDDCGHYI